MKFIKKSDDLLTGKAAATLVTRDDRAVMTSK